ncbi:MAG: tetratricopeptide repeat protein [Deltaproteobacteria bacterium]|nr:tetratricopeptide repeat protein [Deltaproteobacteria bacterium]
MVITKIVKVIFLSLLPVFALASVAHAGGVVVEGVYPAVKQETPQVAEKRALENARRQLEKHVEPRLKEYLKGKNITLDAAQLRMFSFFITDIAKSSVETRSSEKGLEYVATVELKERDFFEVEWMIERRFEHYGLYADDFDFILKTYAKNQKETEAIKSKLQSDKGNGEALKRLKALERSFEGNYLLELGFWYQIRAQHVEAVDVLRGALERDKKNLLAYVYLVRAYDDGKKYAEAREFIKAGFKEYPGSARLYWERGYVSLEEEKYEDAIKDFTIAIEKAPQYITLYDNRGTAYAYLEKYDLAIKDISVLVDRLGSDAGLLALAYAVRGSFYAKKEMYDKALADFDKAVRLAPGDPYILFGRAMGNIVAGRKSAGKVDMNTALEKNEFGAFILLGGESAGVKLPVIRIMERVNEYVATQKYSEAIELLKKEKRGVFLPLDLMLPRLYVVLGRETNEHILQLLDTIEFMSRPYKELQLGRYPRMEKTLTTQFMSVDSEVAYLKMIVYAKKNDCEGALKYGERYLGIPVENKVVTSVKNAYAVLSGCKEAAGDFESALDYFAKGYDTEGVSGKEKVAIALRAGNINLQRKNIKEAIRWFNMPLQDKSVSGRAERDFFLSEIRLRIDENGLSDNKELKAFLEDIGKE